MDSNSELRPLRIVLIILAVGLAVVVALVVRREIIRSNALKNIGKNTIEVSITKTAESSTEMPKAEKNNKDAQMKDIALIQDFYEHLLQITPGEWDKEKYLSAGLLKRIWEKEYEGTYSIWVFRTGFQDGPEDTSKLLSITPTQNGWYKVVYLDMGNRGETLVHVSKGVIDDYVAFDKNYQY